MASVGLLAASYMPLAFGASPSDTLYGFVVIPKSVNLAIESIVKKLLLVGFSPADTLIWELLVYQPLACTLGYKIISLVLNWVCSGATSVRSAGILFILSPVKVKKLRFLDNGILYWVLPESAFGK